ncbi:MAG: hypothetical protein H0T99_09490 [Geodermatophilaceae bacterium]|nr:hypothetical protein [Geodermatophilaceae bacterium]
MSDSPVSRRTVLLAGAGLAAVGLGTGLGGCEATSGQPATPTAAAVDPLTPVLIGQQELLATYERSITAFPDLTAAVSDLQAQSSAHTEALRAAAPAAAAQVSASASPSAPPSQSGSSPGPPADLVTARSDLRRAVQAAAGTLRAAALRADGDLAALLGSCAASTACHVRLLG